MAALPLAPMTRATLQLAGANLLLGTLRVFVVESGQDTVTVVFWRCVFGALAEHLDLPHIRALASDAVAFRNHYSVTSPCGPSP